MPNGDRDHETIIDLKADIKVLQSLMEKTGKDIEDIKVICQTRPSQCSAYFQQKEISEQRHGNIRDDFEKHIKLFWRTVSIFGVVVGFNFSLCIAILWYIIEKLT